MMTLSLVNDFLFASNFVPFTTCSINYATGIDNHMIHNPVIKLVTAKYERISFNESPSSFLLDV